MDLTVDPAALRLPPACAACGAGDPMASMWVGPLEVPLCVRCREITTIKQSVWVAALLLLGLVLTVTAAAVADALAADWLRAHRTAQSVIVFFALVLIGLPAWWGVRRRFAAFHRRFSVVSLTCVTPRGLTLRIRRPELAREIAWLSGLSPAAEGPYRAPVRPASRPLPEGLGGAKASLIRLSLVLAGVMIMGGGVAEYWKLADLEARHQQVLENVLVVLIYDLFGKIGVLVLFLALGLGLTILGVVLVRRALRRLL